MKSHAINVIGGLALGLIMQSCTAISQSPKDGCTGLERAYKRVAAAENDFNPALMPERTKDSYQNAVDENLYFVDYHNYDELVGEFHRLLSLCQRIRGLASTKATLVRFRDKMGYTYAMHELHRTNGIIIEAGSSTRSPYFLWKTAAPEGTEHAGGHLGEANQE